MKCKKKLKNGIQHSQVKNNNNKLLSQDSAFPVTYIMATLMIQ